MRSSPIGPSQLRLIVVPNADGATEVVYQLFAAALMHPSPRVGLATGRTFARFFDRVVAEEVGGRADLSQTTFTHLDEFVGLPPGGEGGMVHELKARLFSRLARGVAGFHPVPADLVEPAAGLVELLESLPPLDLQLLGIGQNGHVAFNEPGTPFALRAQVTSLHGQTVAANGARFPGSTTSETALTMGPQAILDAGQVVLLATGGSKANAVRTMLEDPISPACPASLVRLHRQAWVVLDEAAAAELTESSWWAPERLPDVVLRAPDLNPGGPIVVIAPHPDDGSLSCGGLLASLPPSVEKHIMSLTTGSRARTPLADTAKDVAVLREAEARQEAQILGCSAFFLRGRFYDSRAFENDDVDRLLAELLRIRPAWLLAPALQDPHPTHRLTRQILDAAVTRLVAETGVPVEVWTFEGAWHQHLPSAVNTLVVFDEAAEAVKLSAARAHKSQLGRVPFDEGAKALARLRAVAFSESHLGGREPGGMRELPLVEAYIREVY